MRSRRPLVPYLPRAHAPGRGRALLTETRRDLPPALAVCDRRLGASTPCHRPLRRPDNATDSVPLVHLEALQLHLDETARVELELLRAADSLAIRLGGERGVFDDDALVALDQRVDEQLVRPGVELEMLE